MDLNKTAFRIVKSITEQNKDTPRSRAARIGGQAGGPARARRLTAEQRREIALKANRARWSNGS